MEHPVSNNDTPMVHTTATDPKSPASPVEVLRKALQEIQQGSQKTGRWLDEAGAECDEGADGARWIEFTPEEQADWLQTVTRIASEALAATEGSAS